jgi:hypothetical protein
VAAWTRISKDNTGAATEALPAPWFLPVLWLVHSFPPRRPLHGIYKGKLSQVTEGATEADEMVDPAHTLYVVPPLVINIEKCWREGGGHV